MTALTQVVAERLAGDLDDLMAAGGEVAAALHVYLEESPMPPGAREAQRTRCAQAFEQTLPDVVASLLALAHALTEVGALHVTKHDVEAWPCSE